MWIEFKKLIPHTDPGMRCCGFAVAVNGLRLRLRLRLRSNFLKPHPDRQPQPQHRNTSHTHNRNRNRNTANRKPQQIIQLKPEKSAIRYRTKNYNTKLQTYSQGIVFAKHRTTKPTNNNCIIQHTTRGQ